MSVVLSVGMTGATGFIGDHLLHSLARSGGYTLRALTRTLRAGQIDAHPSVHWVQGDLNQPDDCADFVRDIDVVLHLAHGSTPLTSNRHLPGDALANLVPSLHLVQAIREAGTGAHLVFASSGGAVYGPLASGCPARETHPPAPSSSYGIQKLATEHYLRLAAEHGWLTAVALRIANPYGVLLPPERRQGFIGVALNRIVNGQPVKIFGDPNNVRDYVHLEDVARAFALATTCRTGYSVWNIGSGRGHSVADVIRMIEEYVGRPVTVETVPVDSDAGDLPPWNVLDVSRVAEDLGWRPQIQFEDGLRRLCQYASELVQW